MTVTINGIECEPGCWVDGHWGQYGPDHLADKIEGLITLEPDDDPRVLRQLADAALETYGTMGPVCAGCHQPLDYRRDRERWVHVIHFRAIGLRLELDHATWCGLIEQRPTWPVASIWEQYHEATNAITERLNEITPEGWTWDWVDGEFFLMPICGLDADDCEDEECAHRAYC